MQEYKTYPRHEKYIATYETPFETVNIDYGFMWNPSALTETENKLQNRFLFSENLYSNISLAKNFSLEDRILIEQNIRLSAFNTIPLYFNDYVYYQKNSEYYSGHELDVFRMPRSLYERKQNQAIE